MKILINKSQHIGGDSNVLSNEFPDVITSMMELFEARYKGNWYMPSVNLFKKVFGRQQITKIYGSEQRRFWIWTFSAEEQPDSVIYALVNNRKGICWEYNCNARKSHMMDIFKETMRILMKYGPN